MSQQLISIVIPVYNEGENVERAYDAVKARIRRPQPAWISRSFSPIITASTIPLSVSNALRRTTCAYAFCVSPATSGLTVQS